MASRRKRFATKGESKSNAHTYAEFIAELLAGTVVATRLHDDGRDEHGRVRLEYDDPNG